MHFGLWGHHRLSVRVRPLCAPLTIATQKEETVGEGIRTFMGRSASSVWSFEVSFLSFTEAGLPCDSDPYVLIVSNSFN